jgi:type III secretory pathway lipoprotein EscJ
LLVQCRQCFPHISSLRSERRSGIDAASSEACIEGFWELMCIGHERGGYLHARSVRGTGMRLRATLWLIIVVLSIIGCGSTPVANDLSQRESLEIIAALRERGIEATSSKERGGKGQYSVVVSSSEFGRAASILHSLGLPGEHKASFSELVAPSGILPSSKNVEDLRIDRARAAEIEDLLKGYPVVSKANVLVRYQALENSATPSVSIVVQKRAEASLDLSQVKQLVARAIPGIKDEDVVVSVTDVVSSKAATPEGEAAPSGALVPFLVFWRVPEGDYNGLALIMIGLLVSVSLMAGLAGYIFGQYTVARQNETRHFEPLEGGLRREQIEGPPTGNDEGDAA